MKIKRFIAFILAMAMAFSTLPMNTVVVEAASLMGIKYSMLEADANCPYMVVIDKGFQTYEAFKSSKPLWYVTDDLELIVREDAVVKHFMYSTTQKKWMLLATSTVLAGNNIYPGLKLTVNQITDFTMPENGLPLQNHNRKAYPEMIKTPETAQETVDRIAKGLSLDVLGIAASDTVNGIHSSLTPKSSVTIEGNVYNISWTSGNTTFLSHSGAVTRPIAEQGNRNVIYTATISDGSAYSNRSFVITIIATGETSQDRAVRIADALDETVLGLNAQSSSEITSNLTLVTSITDKGQSIPITWFSNNPAISHTGVVTRPLYSAGDSQGVMIATVTVNGQTSTHQFYTVVKKQVMSAAETSVKVADSMTYLHLGLGTNPKTSQITTNLSPVTSLDGLPVTWVSSNPSVLSNTGVVTRPPHSMSDVDVIYTAIVNNNISATHKFYLRVLKQGEADDIRAVRLAGELTIDSLGISPAESPYEITSNLMLMNSIMDRGESFPISWSSSDASVIAVNGANDLGIVSRPAYTMGDITGAMTATVNVNGQTATKSFSIKVLKQPESDTEKLARVVSGINEGLIILAPGDNTKAVTQNIQLRNSWDGCVITWSSNLPGIIANDGTVSRPPYVTSDANVRLTATVELNGISEDKAFDVVVLKLTKGAETNAEIASRLTDTLTPAYLNLQNNETTRTIESDFDLTDIIIDGVNNYDISWSVINPPESPNAIELIDDAGNFKAVVNKPLNNVGDAAVQITAEITVGMSTASKIFNATVLKYQVNPEMDARTLAGLITVNELGLAQNETINTIQSSLVLSDTVNGEQVIAWNSSNPAVISNTGIVTRPAGANANVTLTATVTKDLQTSSRSFNVTVLKELETDAEKAVRIAQRLTSQHLGLQAGDSLTSIKNNLSLVTNGIDGHTPYTISWVSSNPSISNEGVVTRPAYREGDSVGSLIATVHVGASTSTHLYTTIVNKLALSDAEEIAIAKTNLSLGNLNNVTSDLTLPFTQNGVSISWSSNKPMVISNTGEVTRPAAGEGDCIVTLTAALSCGTQSDTRQFMALVLEDNITDAQKVAIAKANINLGSLNNVTSDLVLPSFQDGVEVTWISSNPAIITNDGSVFRPAHNEGDRYVTLTATLTSGFYSDTKSFKALVTAQSADDAKKAVMEKANLTLPNMDNVTSNIALPVVQGAATVTWVSSNPDVISDTGVVTRPIYGKGDAVVNLTATLSVNGSNETKTFKALVRQADITDSDIVIRAKNNLKLMGLDNVTSNIALPLNQNGASIVWTSSDTSVIANDGTVTRPLYGQGDKKVALTATIENNTATTTRTFTAVVKESSFTDSAKVFIAKQNLTLQGLNNVTTDIVLPAVQDGVTIEWASSDISVIANDGFVSRPAYGKGDKYVTLTATLTHDTATESKQFIALVKERTVTDAQMVAVAKQNLALTGLDNVTSNILLPASQNGAAVTWSSSNPAVIAEDGIVTRPAFLMGKKRVTLTATLEFNGITDTKSFQAYVVPEGLIDLLRVAFVKSDLSLGSLNNVTTDLTLPTTLNGAAITWSSSDISIVSNDGAVTRPLYGQGDKYVSLTATVDINGVNSTKTFKALIKQADIDDSSKLMIAKNNLTLGNLNNVTESLILPDMQDGVTISWVTSMPSVIDTNGIVNRPSFGQGNKMVMLTASLTAGTASDTKSFTAIVKEADITEAYIVAVAKENLGLPDLNSVTEDIVLPATKDGAAISWTSSMPSVIDSDGKVTRPDFGEGNRLVVLTASITFGSVNDTKIFHALVLQQAASDLDRLKIAKTNLNISGLSLVTEDLALPTEQDGAVISWSSDDISIIDNEGRVTRPAYGEGSRKVVLTAAINVNGTSVEKTFVAFVAQQPMTESQKVKTAKNNLFLGDLSSVANDLILPDMQDDVAVSWSSDNPSIIANDGTVTRPAFMKGDIKVTLTATLISGAETETKTFTANIIRMPISDSEKVTIAKNNLFLGELNNVTNNLILPTSQDGATVTWTSDFTDIVADDGTVKRPGYLEGDKVVTLTADIASGAFNAVKIFKVIVKKKDITDADKVSIAVSNLRLSGLTSVTTDLVLPITQDGADVSWASSEAAIIANDGTVTRPGFLDGNRMVTLTAAIALGEAYIEKEFSATVLKNDITDSERADIARNNLTLGDLREVTANLVLPEAQDGAEISWESSSPTVISSTGVVTRAAFGQGDLLVSLTATLNVNGAVTTKVFQAIVKEAPMNDAQIVAKAKQDLSIEDVSSIDSARTILLPSSLAGASITWTSSHPAIISNAGVVSMPNNTTEVTLTATISKGIQNTTKAFKALVWKNNLQNFKKLEYASDPLILSFIHGAPVNNQTVLSGSTIFMDLTLPSVVNGCAVTWTSLNPAVISNTGKILSYNASAQLRGRFTCGADIREQNFTFNVFNNTDETVFADATLGMINIPVSQVNNTAITLPTSYFGNTITWTTDNTDVLLNDKFTIGDDMIDNIVEPSYGTATVTAQYTAAVTVGAVTRQKSFTVVVPPAFITDTFKLSCAENALNLFGIDNLTNNLLLPDTIHEAAITWTSSDTSVVDNDGTITRLPYGQGNGTATLTATLDINGNTATKTFDIVAASLNETDMQRVSQIKKNLNLDNIALASSNINLPTVIDGVDIAWTSSKPDIVADDGTITRPDYICGNSLAVLTAALSSNGAEDTKTFNINIEANALAEAEALNLAKTNFSLTAIDNIASDISLPTAFEDAVIYWTSSDEAVIANDGTVTRPVYGQGNAIVSLTAAFDVNGITDTKSFEAVVIQQEETDAQKVAAAKANLNLFGIDTLTSNIILPSEFSGVGITWISADETVISNSGAITRPEYEDSNKAVTLTATLDLNGAVDTKVFDITVIKKDINDTAILSLAKENLNLTGIYGLTSSISLPAAQDGASISWTTSDSSIIDNIGTITRPAFNEGKRTAVLTATLTINGVTDTKEFDAAVLQNEMTDLEALELVKRNLVLNDIHAVTDNLILPLVKEGANITWSSSNPDIAADNGAVTRPVFGSGNIKVDLTATIDINGTTDTKTFSVCVLQQDMSDANKLIAAKQNLVLTGIDSISNNIVLPVVQDDALISWTSSSPEVVADNGIITRPAFGMGNKTALLTAAIDVNGAVETKVFTVTVLQEGQADTDKVAITKNNLSLTGINGLDSNISLPDIQDDTNITWSSSDEDVIKADGTISRPAFGEGNKTAVLTATIEANGVTDTKEFNITVLQQDVSNADIVEMAMQNIDFGDIHAITSDITLPSLLNGAVIAWSSDDISVIDNDGRVVRPDYGTGNKTITLTANITFDGATQNKTYAVTVLQKEITASDKVEAFKNNLVLSNIHAVTNDITLPDIYDGIDISWTTSDSLIISNTGSIIRPTYGQGNAKVTLTANFNIDGTADSKAFEAVIVQENQTDADKLAMVKENLTLADIDILTENISLPAFSGDAAITWTSENPSAIDNNGVIARPAFGSGNNTAVLIATLDINGFTETKNFTTTVLQENMSDNQKLAFSKENLSLLDTNQLTTDLILPVSQDFADVTWTSSNEGVIADDGRITRPAYGQSNSTATLTAALEVGGITDTKTFDIIVLQQSQSDAEKAAQAKQNLMLPGATQITSNILLPNTQDYAAITWTSSNADVISNMGIVTRPEFGSGNIDVDLTAFIEVNGTVDTKIFTVTVLQKAISDEQRLALAKNNLMLSEYDALVNNITLPDACDGAAIVWSSSDDSVITDTGIITRSVNGFGNKTAVLTADLTLGTAADTKAFTVKVIQEDYIDNGITAQEIAEELPYSILGLNNMQTANTIQSDLSLAASGTYKAEDYTIAWTSANPAISNTGIVTRPAFGEAAAVGNLTAVVTKLSDGTTADIVIPTKVLAAMESDQAIADRIAYMMPESVLGLNTAKEKIYEIRTDLNNLFDTYLIYPISWTSDNSAIEISLGKGKVARPVNADLNVTLTASINVNGFISAKSFVVTVAKIEEPETDMERAQRVANEIGLNAISIIGDNEDRYSVKSNLVLAGTVNDGARTYTVSWASDKSDIIDSNGNVTRPQDIDTTVTLTPYVTVNGQTAARSTGGFSLIVLRDSLTGESDQDRADRVAGEMTYKQLGFDGNSAVNLITDNLTLAPNMLDGDMLYNISWASSDTTIIANNGLVTKQPFSSGIKTVNLTATVHVGAAVSSRVFSLAVDTLPESLLERSTRLANNLRMSQITFAAGDDYKTIKDNLILGTVVMDGITPNTVAWTSSNPDIISNSGNVTRPAYGSGNANVIMTATVNGLASYNYNLVVLQQDYVSETDQARATRIANNLTNAQLGMADGDAVSYITSNLSFISYVEDLGDDISITWSSSNTSIITNSGNVYRPSASAGNANITLTATVHVGAATANHIYNVVVIRQGSESDQETADRLANKLNTFHLGLAPNESMASITSSLNLKNTITDKSISYPITWSVPVNPYIANTGIVTRPESTAGNQTITLTATVNVNGAMAGKSFEITILKKIDAPAAASVEINGFRTDSDKQFVQMAKTDIVLNEKYQAIVKDAFGNPIDTETVVWTLTTSAQNEQGVTMTASAMTANLAYDRDKIQDNILPSEDNTANENKTQVILTAANGGVYSDLTITIEKEIVPQRAEEELIMERTFVSQTLKLGKYGIFPTNENYPFGTLVDYGDTQLYFMTNAKPFFNTARNAIVFKSNPNILIYKAIDTNWKLLSDAKNLDANFTEIKVDKNINSIEYINYELTNLIDEVLMKETTGNYKSSPLPQLPTLEGYNYTNVFSMSQSNYVTVLMKNRNTVENGVVSGNDPEDMAFYSLVGNSWVRNTVDDFYSKLFANTLSYIGSLVYSSFDIQDTGTTNYIYNQNLGGFMQGTPNYFSHIMNLPVSAGKSRIYYESPEHGIRVLVHSGRPYVENGALVFDKTETVKEYVFLNNDWTESAALNVFSGDIYNKFAVVSALRYSDTPITNAPNGAGTVLFTSGISDNIVMYDKTQGGRLDGVIEPPNMPGFPNKVIFTKSDNKICIYSEQPLNVTTTNLISMDDQTIKVKRYNGGVWTDVPAMTKRYKPFIDDSSVENIILQDVYPYPNNPQMLEALWNYNVCLWSNYTLRRDGNNFSPQGISGDFLFNMPILPAEDPTEGLEYPYYLYIADGSGGYYLQKFDTPNLSKENSLLFGYDNRTRTKLRFPIYSKWKDVLFAVGAKGEQIGLIPENGIIRDENMNDFKPVEVVVDTVSPTIMAVYVYKGKLYVIGTDDKALHLTPYGFRFNQQTTLPIDLTGLDAANNLIEIPSGQPIPPGTVVYKANNNQGIKIPLLDTIEVIVRDRAGNMTTQAVNIDADNKLLYGTITPEIQEMLDEANSPQAQDTTPPVITGIYMYRGELCVIGTDDLALHSSAYGFKFLDNTILSEDIAGYDVNGDMISIPAGMTIPANTIIYKPNNHQLVNIGSPMTVILRDRARNEAAKEYPEFVIDGNNKVLWGTVTPYILSLLNAESSNNNEENNEDKNPPTITAIYVYKGKVYVMGSDDVALHLRAYGFKWLNDSTLDYNLDSVNAVGTPVNISVGQTIAAHTEVYNIDSSQHIKIPTLMEITLRDMAGNKTKRQILFDRNNAVYYGDVPPSIQKIIDIENGINNGNDDELEDKTPPIITRLFVTNRIIYVEGYDEGVGLHDRAYGFSPETDMVIDSDYVGLDINDVPINIIRNNIISNHTKIYKIYNNQEVMIPMKITISLRDKNGNETSVTVDIDRDNSEIDVSGNNGSSGGNNGNNGGNNNGGGNNGGGVNGGVVVEGEGNVNPGGSGVIITPPDSFKEIKWDKDHKYKVTIIDKTTNEVVYVITLDKLEKVQIPRLEDSTTYKVEEAVIYKESVKKVMNYQVTTVDKTPPTITEIFVEGNKIFVLAYDKGGLHAEAFSIRIGAAPVAYQKENWKFVVSTDTVYIKVRDKVGNEAEAIVKANKKGLRIANVNFDEPYVVYSDFSMDKQLLVQKLAEMYGLTGNLSLKQTHGVKIEGNVVTLDRDTGIIFTIYDAYKDISYNIAVKVMNGGKSNRTIIVQKGSAINFPLIFKDMLIRTFGTYKDIPYSADNTCISKAGTLVSSNSEGIGKITVKYGDVEMNFFVVSTADISELDSGLRLNKEDIPFTLLLNSKADMKTYLDVRGAEELLELTKKYFILETFDAGVKIKDLDAEFLSRGVKKLNILNALDDTLKPVVLEVIEIDKTPPSFTDIEGNWAKNNIEDLAAKGIIGRVPDNKYKPNNNITIKDFLTMINRYQMLELPDMKAAKKQKEIALTNKDGAYYHSMNILMDLTQEEVDGILGTNTTFNRSITRKEAVQIISKILLKDEYHEQIYNKRFYDVDYSKAWVEDLELCVSMGIINGYTDNTFKPNNNIQRSEVTTIIMNLYKFFTN